MRLVDALQLPSLRGAQVVAGREGLEREIRWVHVVDIPEPGKWVRAGQLLLTTGYAWSHDRSGRQTAQVRSLAEAGLAALGLAVPRYVRHFSTSARREGDRLGLPLLEIPWDIPFTQITEEVHRALLGEQAELLERAEAIHRELTRVAAAAAGLQDVAASLGKLLGRSVAFEDAGGALLAHHVIADQEDEVRRQTIAQARTPKRVLRTLEREGYLEAIRRSASAVTIPAIPALGMSARVAAPIRLAGEIVGCVWVLQGERPLGDLDRRAAEQAALVAALQIARLREIEQIEQRLGSDLVTSLLDDGVEATPQLLERAAVHGFDRDASYRVALVVFDAAHSEEPESFRRRERYAARLRRHLADRGAPVLVAATHREIDLVLREDVSVADLRLEIEGEPPPRVVIGRSARGIEEIRRSCAQARALVPASVPGVVAEYDALLVPRTLLGDAEARAALVERIFGKLRGEPRGERLAQTLLALIAAGFAQNVAARQMGIHSNTLRYRLERIERALGVDLERQEDRFTLQIAAQVLSLGHKDALRHL